MTIGIVSVLLAEGSLVNDAVNVTVVPTGTSCGAVKIETPPSEVCAGAKTPQAPPVRLPVFGLPPQVTVQSTPAPLGSLTGVHPHVGRCSSNQRRERRGAAAGCRGDHNRPRLNAGAASAAGQCGGGKHQRAEEGSGHAPKGDCHALLGLQARRALGQRNPAAWLRVSATRLAPELHRPPVKRSRPRFTKWIARDSLTPSIEPISMYRNPCARRSTPFRCCVVSFVRPTSTRSIASFSR